MPRIKKRHEPSLVERALALAVEAHWGHQDGYAKPYILHPLDVMHRLDDEEAQVVAVLHDTVENGGDRISFERLRAEGYPDTIIDAIDCMTDREGESYQERIERVAVNPLARRVAIAHLQAAMGTRGNFEITADEETERRNWALQRLQGSE
jgi:(p)ppGpp synthase/HD superfamily hydrolase